MSLVFEQVRDDNNKLWKKVRFVREAVLDGDNLAMISARATKQTKYLDQVKIGDSISFYANCLFFLKF